MEQTHAIRHPKPGGAARPRARTATAALLALFVAAGCGIPVGVKRANPRWVHDTLTGNVLSTGRLSNATWNRLRSHGLDEAWKKSPESAIASLQQVLGSVNSRSADYYALAELCFDVAEHGGGRAYFAASAIYAYAFLFPDPPGRSPDPFDPRLRDATDLYNRGLTSAFESGPAGEVAVASTRFAVPFGTADLFVAPEGTRWHDRVLTRFVPAAELQIVGLRNRYRQPGIGAPLAASTAPLAGTTDDKTDSYLSPTDKVPATMILRIANPRAAIAAGHVTGQVEIHPAAVGDSIEIGGQTIPFESEPTAALAATLAESPAWEAEIKGFFTDLVGSQEIPNLTFTEPYRRGTIPVVLVHGTASSANRWADVVNDLENDRAIRSRYTFWHFTYDTGSFIPYSAWKLRQSLEQAVRDIDPEGREPALRKMVVIGHSQGGLLTKMTSIDSGDRFWKLVSRRPLSELDLSDEDRQTIKSIVFVRPLPFVRRVIFLATPHGGSYLALFSPAKWLRGFIKLPSSLAKLGTNLITLNQDKVRLAASGGKQLPTSIDNMTPGNPFLRTLHDTPVAPGVGAHSIIAVVGGEQSIQPDGGDGVVKYESAHVEGVESEVVVDSSHSCQSNPHAIAEIRRILLLNADTP